MPRRAWTLGSQGVLHRSRIGFLQWSGIRGFRKAGIFHDPSRRKWSAEYKNIVGRSHWCLPEWPTDLELYDEGNLVRTGHGKNQIGQDSSTREISLQIFVDPPPFVQHTETNERIQQRPTLLQCAVEFIVALGCFGSALNNPWDVLLLKWTNWLSRQDSRMPVLLFHRVSVPLIPHLFFPSFCRSFLLIPWMPVPHILHTFLAQNRDCLMRVHVIGCALMH